MQCPDTNRLIRYLLVKLAPVILGVKPAGLLRLTDCRQTGGKQHDLFCLHQPEILATLQLRCRILRRNSENLVVFFFREGAFRTAQRRIPGRPRIPARRGTGRAGIPLPERKRIPARNRGIPRLSAQGCARLYRKSGRLSHPPPRPLAGGRGTGRIAGGHGTVPPRGKRHAPSRRLRPPAGRNVTRYSQPSSGRIVRKNRT